MIEQASSLLSRQDAKAAYALLAAAEAQRAGEPRFDYLLGIAALDAGHVTRAIFALERAVQISPDDRLARAELGRAYLAAGDVEAARRELRIARADAPEAASAAIDRVIATLDTLSPAQGLQLSAYLELGVGYDSNVNSATSQGEFAIPAFGGILFQNAPESRQRHDQVLIAAGGVHAEYALTKEWKLVGNTHVRSSTGRVVHDMNTVFVDTTLGARRTAGRHSQTIALQNGTAWVGQRSYRSANGLTAQWQSQLGRTAQASVFGQWSRQRYEDQVERNTDRTLLGLGFAREFGGAGPLAYGSVFAARERAARDELANFGHRAAGLRLGAELRVAANSTLFAEWQHERRRYGGSEPFFDTARRDRQHDLSAGLRYRPSSAWQLIAQARHTRAASNVVLYDYSRNVVQITAQRSFP